MLGSGRTAWGLVAIEFESEIIRNFTIHMGIRLMGFYCFTAAAPTTVIFLKNAE